MSDGYFSDRILAYAYLRMWKQAKPGRTIPYFCQIMRSTYLCWLEESRNDPQKKNEDHGWNKKNVVGKKQWAEENDGNCEGSLVHTTFSDMITKDSGCHKVYKLSDHCLISGSSALTFEFDVPVIIRIALTKAIIFFTNVLIDWRVMMAWGRNSHFRAYIRATLRAHRTM